MNLSNLSKEQKQYIFLGLMLSIGVIFALYRFVLTPFIDKWGDSQDGLASMQLELKTARMAIQNRSQIEHKLQESASNMIYATEHYLPPMGTTLAWATERIYRRARLAGVEIEAVDELGSTRLPTVAGAEDTRMFKPYSVRVTTTCGYYQVQELIRQLSENNPLLLITDLQVVGRSATPEEHAVSLTLQWPLWRDEKDLERLKKLAAVAQKLVQESEEDE